MLSDLLLALDAILAADGKSTGFDGRLVICVKDGALREIWSARLGERPWSGFLTAIPEDTDALMVLDGVQAQAIAEGRPLPDPSAAAIGGDRSLLARFFKRYFAFSNWLDIRAGGRQK